MSGCGQAPEPPKAEEPAPARAVAAAPAPEPITAEASPIPPPTDDEARAKVNLIFEGVVNVDASRSPYLLSGDFNGDGSQDLALIVRPVHEKLQDINSEVANWILGDPTVAAPPDLSKSVQQLPKPKPVHIESTDSPLLAVIHGHGPNGWRDPLARQTYLLKNAIGSNPATKSVAELAAAARNKTSKPSVYANVSKKGNVIKQKLGNSTGFLYYTGAKYVWYELK
jgi:hypothetical protein